MSPLKHHIHHINGSSQKSSYFYKAINNKNYVLRFNYVPTVQGWMHFIYWGGGEVGTEGLGMFVLNGTMDLQ